MKQKVLYILLFVFSVLLGTGDVLAQTQYYVLDPISTEYRMDDHEEIFTLEGPGSLLIFEYYFDMTNNEKRKLSVYASKAEDIDNYSFQDTKSYYHIGYEETSLAINGYDGKLKFVGTDCSSLSTKNIKNIRVTRASEITPQQTNLTAEVPIGGTNTAYLTVEYGNTNNMGKIRVSYISGVLSNMSPVEVAVTKETGSVTMEIPFSAENITENGDYIGELKVEHLAYDKSQYNVDCTETIDYTLIVKKTAPTIDFKEQTYYPNHVYGLSSVFKSPNEETTPIVSISSGNNAVIIGNKLFILSTGSFTLSVTQQGNDKWETITQTHTITVNEGDVRTPELERSAKITIPYNGSDKIVALPGPCDKVSLFLSEQLWATGSMTVSYYDEATSGWTVLLSNYGDLETGTKEFVYNIPRTATQLKFTKPSTLEFYVDKIIYHMAEYMIPSSATVAMPETMQGKPTTKNDITVDWSDATIGALSILSDNSNFSATPQSVALSPTNSTWGTDVNATWSGENAERWGRSTLSINYTPKTTGTHTGHLYFHDNKRFVRIPVAGTAYSNHLKLQPSVNLNTQHLNQTYQAVALNRTLPDGFSTLTLPFNTKVSQITDANSGDYVAQLALVTYNVEDGYTLYFQKTGDDIVAHQPYVLYRTYEVESPQWGETFVESPKVLSVSGNASLQGWTMTGNYTPSLSMSGKYGIAGGEFCKGLEGSTLNAYTAYFTPPTSGQNVRTRVAIMDGDGNATYIGELKDGKLVPEAIYGADGIQQSGLKKGINIVRTMDGTVRKIWKR